jgi:hypothetical protein
MKTGAAPAQSFREEAMKAYELIARAALDATHVNFIHQTFDDAWKSIAPKYRTH